MPTYEELKREAVWNAEVVPTALHNLAVDLSNFWGLSRGKIGMVGDNHHLSGYHRSRNWLLQSRYARVRDYSTTETLGNGTGGDGNAVSAMDITLPREHLIVVCRNLDRFVRMGQLEKITEWYGNSDGDGKVDGYNNVANRIESSNPSHLWHLHMSFDRGRVIEAHDDVFRALTNGTVMIPSLRPQTGPTPTQGWTDTMIANAPTLRRGDSGDYVRTLQGLLCARRWTVAIDGDFGPRTESAVRRAQDVAGGIAVDGICGPRTWPVLFAGRRAA